MDNHSTKDTFAKRVLARITDEHLAPRPRWEFLFKNYFFWGLGALAVVLGAFAFSAMFFEVANVDWNLALVTHSTFLAFFFDAAPFLWAGALIVFIFIGYLNVRWTNHGYRYPLTLIAVGAVLTSIVLGMALFAVGLGSTVEDISGAFRRPILATEHSWWLAPDKGLLGGAVESVAPGLSSFTLRDFNGVLWQIDGSDLRARDQTAVAHGGVVRVVGVPTMATSSEFHACFVLAWGAQAGSPHRVSPPLATIASTSEIGRPAARSEECRGIRPYQQLYAADETGP